MDFDSFLLDVHLALDLEWFGVDVVPDEVAADEAADYGAWKEKGYVYGERDLEMDDLR